MDAVVALSEYGAGILREKAGVDPDRVHVIPHGAFDYLTSLPEEAPLPAELAAVEGPVVLFFGLVRPYKGVDVLLDAFAGIEGAELWVVGRPLGMEVEPLRELAERVRGRVRFVSRFVADKELPAFFRRADVVALPYRDAEQSGVLFTALAFGKPVVLSDVGGFGEVAATGAARLVPAGDAMALRAAIAELLTDDGARVGARGRGRGGRGRAVLVGRRGGADARPLPRTRPLTAVAIAFWAAAGLLVYTHLGYPLVLWALTRGRSGAPAAEPSELPFVSLIVAARDEEASVPGWMDSALAMDYPRDRLEVIIVSDGSSDGTADAARRAGADVVLSPGTGRQGGGSERRR